MFWTPIVTDQTTKQTWIFSSSDGFIHFFYTIPSLINRMGQRFSMAKLISVGYASFVRGKSSAYSDINISRYFKVLMVIFIVSLKFHFL